MTYDQLVRELEDARAQNARLLAILRECRTAIAELMVLAENKGAGKEVDKCRLT